MIIPNGKIVFVSNVGGGLDTNGYPVPSTDSYSEPIDCQYTADDKSLVAISEGEPFIKASYSILVEHLHPCVVTERVQLYNRMGKVIKEASVIKFEPLDAVCQVKIVI